MEVRLGRSQVPTTARRRPLQTESKAAMDLRHSIKTKDNRRMRNTPCRLLARLRHRMRPLLCRRCLGTRTPAHL